MEEPVIFRPPPSIPSGLSDLARYKLEINDYKLRLRSVTWIFLEVIGTILVLGLLWINVDWVKIGVTIVALLIILILLISLTNVL